MNTKNQKSKICEHCKQNFTIKEEELTLYEKVGIELPTICFFCRIKLHLSFWMFGKFRKIKSDLSGKNLITVLPEKNRYPIYTLTEWHSDKWNARLFYSKHSRDCLDSYFLYDCRNCQNCFMCWNLRSKSHCLENIQYTKEEYEKRLKSFKLGSYKSIQSLKRHFAEIIQNEAVHRQNFNFKIYNSDGDYLLDCKNCHNCNTINDSEDCYNCIRGLKHKSEIDANGCWYSELIGNCNCCIDSYCLKYSNWSSARYSEYLDLCIECEYCFGCVGLRKKKYCILNKQYTKESFDELRTRIVGDMKKRGEYGKFLPYSMGAGPFNFSTSFLYFPETKKEDILRQGGYWEDIDESQIERMPTSELPDDIKNVPDTITNQALICPKSGWRFNIAQNELTFYRANNIPLPHYHFDVRTKNRLKDLTILQSYPYKCFYCKKDTEVYYLPEWNYQKIACEECYRQNIA